MRFSLRAAFSGPHYFYSFRCVATFRVLFLSLCVLFSLRFFLVLLTLFTTSSLATSFITLFVLRFCARSRFSFYFSSFFTLYMSKLICHLQRQEKILFQTIFRSSTYQFYLYINNTNSAFSSSSFLLPLCCTVGNDFFEWFVHQKLIIAELNNNKKISSQAQFLALSFSLWILYLFIFIHFLPFHLFHIKK